MKEVWKLSLKTSTVTAISKKIQILSVTKAHLQQPFILSSSGLVISCTFLHWTIFYYSFCYAWGSRTWDNSRDKKQLHIISLLSSAAWCSTNSYEKWHQDKHYQNTFGRQKQGTVCPLTLMHVTSITSCYNKTWGILTLTHPRVQLQKLFYQ